MERITRSLAQTARALLRSPGFSAMVVLILALGVGVNAAIYTALDVVLLKSSPYADVDRLVNIDRSERDPTLPVSPWTYAQYERLSAWQSAPFASVAAHGVMTATVTGGGEPEQIKVEFVSRNYFDVLGVAPLAGVGWQRNADADAAVVLTHAYWQRLGSVPGIVGSTLTVNGRALPIQAVMPPSFRGESGEADVFVPLDAAPAVTGEPSLLAPYAAWLRVLARLPDGVPPRVAEARLPEIDRNWEEAGVVPVAPPRGALRVAPLQGSRVDPSVRGALLLAGGAALLVLLIACLNVSSLLLARSIKRRREFAIRRAIGGTRADIAGQLLGESALLTLVGGVLGLVFASWLLDVLPALTPASTSGFWTYYARAIPFDDLQLNARTFAFAFALTGLCAIVIPILPALRADSAASHLALRQGSATPGGRHVRGRAALVVLQTALALVLLTSAGLLVRSLQLLHAASLGIQRENVLTAKLELPRASYDATRVRQFFQQLRQRVQNEAGVLSTSVSAAVPLADGRGTGDVRAADRPRAENEEHADIWIQAITPGYLKTMGIPLRRGRDLAESDNAPVILVNESAARLLWPNGSAVNQHAIVGFPLRQETTAQVIGVVADVRYRGVNEPVEPLVYLPSTLYQPRNAYLSVRTAREAESFGARLRTYVRELDPNLPVVELRTLEQRIATSTSRTRFGAVLLSAFAGLATLLAALGIYGILAQVVAESRREIGIHIALGSTSRDVLVLFLRRGALLALVGVAVGLLGAFAAARLIRSQLYGVEPLDPLTWSAVIGLLATVALAASVIPALRAMRINPLTALRQDS